MINMQKEMYLNQFNAKLIEFNEKLKGRGIIVLQIVDYSDNDNEAKFRIELHLYYPDGRFWEFIYRSGMSGSFTRQLKLCSDWLDALLEKFDEYVKL